MKILITAGGTTEQIDKVRSITNTSTGMLGSLTAKTFAKLSDTEKIYYICAKTAILPQSEKIQIIPVDNVASLETAVRKVLSEQDIDIIVHSMAVSDYRVKSVSSASMLADSIAANLDSFQGTDVKITDTLVTELLQNADTVMNDNGKISSGIENMILLMERTPKIISLFQTLAPKAVLVAFKLLNNVGHETLIDTAFHILKDNRCSFVLANDLRDIFGEQHIGYLVDKEKNYKRYITKAEIADAIVTAATEKRRK